jgi:glycerate 2-kinase
VIPALRTPGEPLLVLVAPDSFKGSLTSVAVAEALAAGWRRARPGDAVRLDPLADGGEGTLDAVREADPDWVSLPASARDPLGRPIPGRFLRKTDTAMVEMAVASGLSRLASDERDCLAASSFGTGLILAAAIGLGVQRVILGLGGSATTDGGTGLLRALGARFLDEAGAELPDGGGSLADLARVDLAGLSPVLAEVDLVVASDVANPLLGPLGAAAVYGPQKGASPGQVAELDGCLSHYADLLEAAAGVAVRDIPGAGAAGGTTAGLLAIADRFRSFEVRPGVEVMMELTGFEDGLREADLVLTGEGRIDAQTVHGKTVLGVARRAYAVGKPVVAFGGGVTPEGARALLALGCVAVPVVEAPTSLEEAVAAGAAPVERAAERVAHLLRLA